MATLLLLMATELLQQIKPLYYDGDPPALTELLQPIRYIDSSVRDPYNNVERHADVGWM